ncbi:MAG: hypothetical protein QOC73_1135 [Actinomycetota bacterium]|nr:hypothetical protein [Actinomycetota bacterium]
MLLSEPRLKRLPRSREALAISRSSGLCPVPLAGAARGPRSTPAGPRGGGVVPAGEFPRSQARRGRAADGTPIIPAQDGGTWSEYAYEQ